MRTRIVFDFIDLIFIYLSVYLSIYLFTYQFINLFFHSFIYLSTVAAVLIVNNLISSIMFKNLVKLHHIV